MSDLAFQSATNLAKGIQKKTFSSLELTELYIDRIEQHDGEINAVVVRIFDRALDDARNADAALARGENLGPLHGVPMTIKEAYNIEGLPRRPPGALKISATISRQKMDSRYNGSNPPAHIFLVRPMYR